MGYDEVRDEGMKAEDKGEWVMDGFL